MGKPGPESNMSKGRVIEIKPGHDRPPPKFNDFWSSVCCLLLPLHWKIYSTYIPFCLLHMKENAKQRDIKFKATFKL